MKIKIIKIDGTRGKEITLPSIFENPVREDILSKVLEAKKYKQPYAPSPVAGKQHSAKGKIVHRRHVWRSQYGRGISRVPRKIFSQRGSTFNWEAAEVPHAKGGMRAHPPKIASMVNLPKINKKELRLALLSALSATANKKYILKKYSTISSDSKIGELPLVFESNLSNLKTKKLLSVIKNALGSELFSVAIRKKSIRAGKGKLRGRKYKSNAGLLFVISDEESLKTTAFEVKKVGELGVSDLAKGGPGRITIYTENALKELEEKLSGRKEDKK